MNNEIKFKAEKCKCSMRQQLIGDGCEICNPEYMKEKTAKEAAEWINVEMLLPEEDIDQFVLAYHPDWGIEIVHWYQSRWRSIGLDDDAPTHWMPLPPEPEQ